MLRNLYILQSFIDILAYSIPFLHPYSQMRLRSTLAEVGGRRDPGTRATPRTEAGHRVRHESPRGFAGAPNA